MSGFTRYALIPFVPEAVEVSDFATEVGSDGVRVSTHVLLSTYNRPKEHVSATSVLYFSSPVYAEKSKLKGLNTRFNVDKSLLNNRNT